MVSTYTPTLSALLNARRDFLPFPIADMKAVLVAEPHAPGLRYLDNVVDEITTISASLAPVFPVLVVGDVAGDPGPGATVSAVVACLSDAAVVHLACHGQQDRDPLQSGFCLRDARLTVDALMRMDLKKAVFAFLSACETAKGDARQPDQVVHLAAAMLFVGFRSVIATMWCVFCGDGSMAWLLLTSAWQANE